MATSVGDANGAMASVHALITLIIHSRRRVRGERSRSDGAPNVLEEVTGSNGEQGEHGHGQADSDSSESIVVGDQGGSPHGSHNATDFTRDDMSSDDDCR